MHGMQICVVSTSAEVAGKCNMSCGKMFGMVMSTAWTEGKKGCRILVTLHLTEPAEYNLTAPVARAHVLKTPGDLHTRRPTIPKCSTGTPPPQNAAAAPIRGCLLMRVQGGPSWLLSPLQHGIAGGPKTTQVRTVLLNLLNSPTLCPTSLTGSRPAAQQAVAQA